MTWIFVATLSYLINAGVYVADKFMLSKKVHSSITYAFFVGIWSIFNFVLLPLDWYIPTPGWLLIELAAGGLFLFTIIVWYKALHQSEATRVVPIVGCLTPIFTLLLSVIFLGDGLGAKHLFSFSVLMVGGGLISIKQTNLHLIDRVVMRVQQVLGHIHADYRPTRRLLINSTLSAFLFAAYAVLMKFIYTHEPFLGSFVWSRLGTFIGVIVIFSIPVYRKAIAKHQANAKQQTNLAFFLSVRLLAAAAFILLNWAISLGDVAMVNVLQGVQYLFLLIIVLVMSVKYPRVYKEEVGSGVMMQKLAGVALVSLGLYILIS
ncbi:EamA family transporter [Candidatus Falkowbacteria bacterium]|nr:EamA family transporter [Candidatus Falkowbacteria bacterium]